MSLPSSGPPSAASSGTWAAGALSQASNGITAVHVLARRGNLSALQHLHEHHAELLSARSPEGLTPFLSACASGQTRVAAWLATTGHARVDENESNIGATGFHLAAVRNQAQTLKWLLETRPDLVDIKTNDQATPLRIAAEAGFISIVEMLLRYNANPTLADDHNVTPAHVAHVYGHHDVYDLLARAALARIVQSDDAGEEGKGWRWGDSEAVLRGESTAVEEKKGGGEK